MWRDFLNGAIAPLENSGAVLPLSPDRDLFIFTVIANALLARERVELAIEHYIVACQWPDLNAEDTIYVLHRALAARCLVQAMLINPSIESQLKPAPPSPAARAPFIRWLLIETWERAGAAFMDEWAKDYLAKTSGG